MSGFEDALAWLKQGKRVTNESWNGKCMDLSLVHANGSGYHTLPYLMMLNADGDLVPWTPSQMDMFSDGWVLVTGDNK